MVIFDRHSGNIEPDGSHTTGFPKLVSTTISDIHGFGKMRMSEYTVRVPTARIVQCVRCGKKNRISIGDSRMVAMCGCCHAALPADAVNKIKRELQAEEYQDSQRERQRANFQAAQAERLRRIKLKSKAGYLEECLSKIQYMTGRGFELFLGEVFDVAGYERVVTQGSCDQGVDLIVTSRGGRRLAIQAKNHSAAVGNSAVQELYTGMAFYECHAGVVIATSKFTSSAKQVAKKTGIHLWTLAEVRRLLKEGAWFEF
jgi:restriction endonuclease Mrr